MRTNVINEPVIRRQVQASQPSILLVAALWFLPAQGLSLLSSAMMKVNPNFKILVAVDYSAYRGIFFLVQMMVTLLAGIYLARKYKDALFCPRIEMPIEGLKIAALFLVGLLIPKLVVLLSFSMDLLRVFKTHDNVLISQAIAHIYTAVWNSLPYGGSVIYNSGSALVFPILEELLISGFLFNRLARQMRFDFALLLTSAVYVILHLPNFGSRTTDLIAPLTCYVLIRVLTGNVAVSMIAHLLVNVVVFLPKWIVAFLAFRMYFQSH